MTINECPQTTHVYIMKKAFGPLEASLYFIFQASKRQPLYDDKE